MLGGRRDGWLAARLEDPGYGDINGIEAAVRECPLEGIKKDEVGRELGYFLNNAPLMRYRWFRSRGLFAGSGVVEASCKTIVGQRLRQACIGPSQEPTPSSPCAAKRPAAGGKPSATTVTTRQEPPDLPLPEDDYLGAGHLLPAAIS
jgi:hypothetical protein